MLFVASLVAVVAISISMANAEEQKTYTLTEVKTAVVNIPANVGNFLTNEVEKTKEYQAKSWASSKEQMTNNWNTIKGWFGSK